MIRTLRLRRAGVSSVRMFSVGKMRQYPLLEPTLTGPGSTEASRTTCPPFLARAARLTTPKRRLGNQLAKTECWSSLGLGFEFCLRSGPGGFFARLDQPRTVRTRLKASMQDPSSSRRTKVRDGHAFVAP